ncbi:androgen-induced gene 1 protein-like isoform X1 [Eupeodes corollae]|uniref:androgen-induced gene 1 protein-like isoform X1 n=1 Tax=Eupeodes corollae TaxID=290404 RepID=UPI002492B505|nr:androgen-induced gene 1 protein-like isoform X1 [Eupeodes corollae]
MAKGRTTINAPITHAWNQGIYKSLRILLHLIGAVQFIYAIYYDHVYVHHPHPDNDKNNYSFGGKFRFLTFLDAIIQAVYFVICLGNDFIGTNEVAPKKMPAIRKIKDYILAALAFPIALNVGISFWTLYAIDRELVFPKVLDAIFPGWLNHILHTNIVVFIVLEMFTSFRTYPKRINGLTGLIAFMLSYLIWVHVIKHFSGVWVYPVLEVLELPQRIVFFGAILVFTVFLYLFGETINKIVWAKELKLAQRKVK